MAKNLGFSSPEWESEFDFGPGVRVESRWVEVVDRSPRSRRPTKK